MADADRALLSDSPDERPAELGVAIMPSAPGSAHVCAVRRSTNSLFLSGQIAALNGKLVHRRRVGAGVTLAQAQECARVCALNLVAKLKEAVGALSYVASVTKVTVFVASAEGFADQHLVANRASELLKQVFGDAGRHTRSAIGVAGLLKGSPVEVEGIVKLRQPCRVE